MNVVEFGDFGYLKFPVFSLKVAYRVSLIPQHKTELPINMLWRVCVILKRESRSGSGGGRGGGVVGVFVPLFPHVFRICSPFNRFTYHVFVL